MKMIVLGAPGVGKGTYTQELSRRIGIKQISTGDLLRTQMTLDSDLGREIKKYMDAATLVPDELVIKVIIEYLEKNNIKDNFVLDGFPRTIPQAESLDKIMKIDVVINYTTTREIIFDRLGGRLVCEKCNAIFQIRNIVPKVQGICDYCGGKLYTRADDTRESIEKRLIEYDLKTSPLIDYYKNKGILKTLRIDKEFGPHKEEIMKLIFETIGI